MASTLKYMIDDKGDKTSVLVPIKTWEKLNEGYTRLQKKLEVLVGIKNAFTEITAARNTGKELQTLKGFLRESNG